MNRNPIVLSYKESLLRESDVELLKGPYWLNDTIISFYFEYLQSEVFRDNPTILFVSPEVTQCIKVSPQSEISIFLDPLIDNINRDFIFFAVNDNEIMDASGGSHWSLLVFSRPERMILHFDSSSTCNEIPAVELADKILKYFGLPLEGRFENVMCLQQTNSYDCGVHVLCNADQLAHYASHYRRIHGCPQLDPDNVIPKRYEILEIIESLQENHR